MPRVIVTEGAVLGLERCRRFLAEKAQDAAGRAGRVIAEHFQILEVSPDAGRPDEEVPELRELVIPFGDTGYVALYRYEPRESVVYILAFRHQKEVGYRND